MPLRRRLAAAGLAGLAGLLTAPAIGLAPAAAAGPCDKPLGYGATAAADLARLGVLDLRPLGLRLGPVADLTVASAHSGINAKTRVKAAAAARYLDATLAGVPLPAGPLGAQVHQQAPPANARPATANVAERDLGVLRLGAGDLSAHATWQDGMACGTRVGQATTSSAAVFDAAVLPGPGKQALVRMPGNLSTGTATGLSRDAGVVRSVGAAAVGLADIRLFAASPAQLTVKVVEPPMLRVGTGGTRATASVEYDAPVLEVSGPGIGTRRIDSPGRTVDLAVPRSFALMAAAQDAARAAGLPLLADGTLDDLVGAGDAAGARGRAAAGALALPGLPAPPEIPDVTPAAELAGGAPGALPVLGSGALSIVRILLGEVEKRITDRAVRAEAAALRVQVLAGPDEASSLVDLGVGLLSAAAVAPGPVDAPVAEPPAGTGGGLPVTGVQVGVVAGTGLLLLTTGTAMLVVARRGRGRANLRRPL